MVRVSRLLGLVSFTALAVAAPPAAAQVIQDNTPIQSVIVTPTSNSPATAGGTAFFRAEALLADPLASTRILGGGGGAFWGVAWSPRIPVGNCGTTASSFGSQNVSINSQGVFQESWSPGTPNTLLASGSMTMPTGTLVPVPASFSASLACGNNAATGMMAAVWTGERYDGTYSFNGVDGAITVIGLTWSSSDTSVATVDNTGKVTLLAAGDTVITATFGSLCWQTVPGNAACQGTTSGSYELHVEPAPSGGGGGNNGPPLTAGPDQVVECASPTGTPVLLQGQLFFQPTTPLTYTWTGPFAATSGLVATVPFGLGSHTATLTISDGTRTASDSTQITVVDTTAPQIASITANPSVVWPPNGRMVPVSIAVSATDTCSAQVACQGVSVTTNDGASAADWQATGPLSLNVRATRGGSGGGRTYTVTVACSDAAGNTSTATVDVVVPHDRR